MKRRISILALLLLLTPFLGASDKKAADEKKAKKKEQAKATYMQKTEHELDSWAAKIDALQVRISTAGAQVRAKLDEEIQDVRAKLQNARQKLGDLKTSTERDWEHFRHQTNQAVKDVNKAYTTTDNHVKKTEENKSKEKKQ